MSDRIVYVCGCPVVFLVRDRPAPDGAYYPWNFMDHAGGRVCAVCDQPIKPYNIDRLLRLEAAVGTLIENMPEGVDIEGLSEVVRAYSEDDD